MGIFKDFKNVWNAFRDSASSTTRSNEPYYSGSNWGSRPDRATPSSSNERSIITSIFTRISIDVATVEIKHVQLDDKGRYSKEIDSGLNRCLNFEPNLDQTPRALRQDIASKMLDSGEVAIVPVDVIRDNKNGTNDILSLRVGVITQWFPNHVRVNLYNEESGRREDVILDKKFVAIPENPLYNVTNGRNSTLQRLIRKLNLLDAIDEQSGSGKLDVIIQVPYTIRSESQTVRAEQRRKSIENQLKGSQYGIAYSDATEKIVQLNRPVENNLLSQIAFLTKLLYSQLGITESVMDGTADEHTMINYFNRTVEPMVDAIVESIQKSFLGRLGWDKQERIQYYRDPFRLVSVSSMAEIADKFTRNEILSANEIRGYMGIAPAGDPNADVLKNANMPADARGGDVQESMGDNEMTAILDELDATIDDIFTSLEE